jgi:hypothetical protein
VESAGRLPAPVLFKSCFGNDAADLAVDFLVSGADIDLLTYALSEQNIDTQLIPKCEADAAKLVEDIDKNGYKTNTTCVFTNKIMIKQVISQLRLKQLIHHCFGISRVLPYRYILGDRHVCGTNYILGSRRC